MTAARLWSADGLTATLHGHPDGSGHFTVLVDGETEPTRTRMDGWQFAPCCGYCDRPAEMQEIDGQPDDLLCKVCARAHYDEMPLWVRPIPKRYIRSRYAAAVEQRQRVYAEQATRCRVPLNPQAFV